MHKRSDLQLHGSLNKQSCNKLDFAKSSSFRTIKLLDHLAKRYIWSFIKFNSQIRLFDASVVGVLLLLSAPGIPVFVDDCVMRASLLPVTKEIEVKTIIEDDKYSILGVLRVIYLSHLQSLS